jgi:hypothetical protein
MTKYQLFRPGKAEQQEMKRPYVGSTVRNTRSIFRIFCCTLLHRMKKPLSMLCRNPLMHAANYMDPIFNFKTKIISFRGMNAF